VSRPAHSEHGQGLGLKTCSFEAQGVPGPSILLSVFPYPAMPEVGTGKPASVGASIHSFQVVEQFLLKQFYIFCYVVHF
jgi:hypothetical protein